MAKATEFSVEGMRRNLFDFAAGGSSNAIQTSQAIPVLDISGAYTSGDVLAPVMTIANASNSPGGGGVLHSITIIDNTAAQRSAFDILLFSAIPTVQAANAAWAVTDAFMASCIGVVQVAAGNYITTFPGTALNNVAQVPLYSSAAGMSLRMPYVTDAAKSLYVATICRGTPTYVAVTDLVFNFMFTPG